MGENYVKIMIYKDCSTLSRPICWYFLVINSNRSLQAYVSLRWSLATSGSMYQLILGVRGERVERENLGDKETKWASMKKSKNDGLNWIKLLEVRKQKSF